LQHRVSCVAGVTSDDYYKNVLLFLLRTRPTRWEGALSDVRLSVCHHSCICEACTQTTKPINAKI